LQTAWQQLSGATATNQPQRVSGLLGEADRAFQKYRNYYFSLIRAIQPARMPQLSLPQVRELYGRFVACSVAELEANFLLDDFPQWHFRHGLICDQMKEILDFDASDVLAGRVAAIGLITNDERQNLKDQVLATREFCEESRDRIVTAAEEVKWLERRRMSSGDYLREFHAAPDGTIVLVRH